MEQFQYSLFIAGKSQVDNIQPGNVGGNGYDIAILYPPESFIGQFVFGDIMKQLSGERLFYFFNLADVFGRRLQVFVCFGMRRHEVEGQPTVSGLLAAVMSSMKPCLTPLFTQSAM